MCDWGIAVDSLWDHAADTTSRVECVVAEGLVSIRALATLARYSTSGWREADGDGFDMRTRYARTLLNQRQELRRASLVLLNQRWEPGDSAQRGDNSICVQRNAATGLVVSPRATVTVASQTCVVDPR